MELVLEIGCEELPASFQKPALAFLAEQLSRELVEARLHEKPAPELLATYATPRRLAVVARGIAAKAPDARKLVQGPPLKSAFGPDGRPTKAAEGFARKLGVPVEALRPDGDRVVALQELKGQAAGEALPAILDRLVAGIPFRKAMRWGDVPVAFARPVHWIAAALDGARVPVRYGDVDSGLESRGHRFHDWSPFPLPSAGDYVNTLRNHRVLADWEERKQRIWAEVLRAAAGAGPDAEPLPDDDLLETVTGLVEEPTGVLGRFEPHFLELPPEVLVSEMRGHQKYFSVRDAKSRKLLPAFVAVSNTKVRDPAVSQRGYERVLRARLSDGRFFFDEDRKQPLESRLERLGRIVFFQGLGTQLDRVKRLAKLSLWLFNEASKEAPAHFCNSGALLEAAHLCKADLTTGMVGEFPDLQGIMGATYARLEGKSSTVADALEQHYWPKSAEGAIPPAPEGVLLALADRLDQLAGFFGVGRRPSGTADPYALRRAAIGALRLVLEAKGAAGARLRIDLREALRAAQRIHGEQAATGNKVAQAPELVDELWAFVLGRLEVLWKDRAAPDAIEAVLATGARDVVLLEKRLAALAGERAQSPERFLAAAGTFKRVGNILAQAREKGLAAMAFHEAHLRVPAEKALAAALAAARAKVQAGSVAEDYAAEWAVLAELQPAVGKFFEDVMVMDPDAAVRDNRLALLRGLHELFAPLAEFGKLQT